MTKNYFSELIKGNFEQILRELIVEAAKMNLKISIDQINMVPLAMGNYKFEPKVTDARHKKYMSFDELNELISAFVVLKREPVFHEFNENEICISETMDDKVCVIGVMKIETYQQYQELVKQQKENKQNEYSVDSPKSD